MNKINKNKIEEILKNPDNNFPIPLQNIIVENMKVVKKQLPYKKFIDIKDLQTLAYPINSIYKPISKIIVFDK